MLPTERFSHRAQAYDRHRPGYPQGLIDVIRGRTGLSCSSVVADVGCGTGLSSQLFLDAGMTVYGVEPNPSMLDHAARRFQANPRFRPIAGTAEATTLPDEAVDLVFAAQAFHWFDRSLCKREFHRILRIPGWTVLTWNTRRTDTPIGQAYEDLLLRFGNDYLTTRHENLTDQAFAEFFAPNSYEKVILPNQQRLDWQGLRGRLMSTSYLPREGDACFAEMMTAAEALYKQFQSGGEVILTYNCEMYLGCLHSRGTE